MRRHMGQPRRCNGLYRFRSQVVWGKGEAVVPYMTWEATWEYQLMRVISGSPPGVVWDALGAEGLPILGEAALVLEC